MKYSEKIVSEWIVFSSAISNSVSEKLQLIADEKADQLAGDFYDLMLEDEDTAKFLSSEIVQTRLRPAMTKWIISALTFRDEALIGFANKQYDIGNIHSRVGIPASLVLKGMRIITQSMLSHIQSLSLDKAISISMQHYVSVSIQIASELMTYAYENYQVNEAKNEESYRVHNLIANPEIEKGKQQAALFNWENGLMFALVSRTANIKSYLLSGSEFGLWFRHKCSQHFAKQPEIEKINSLIEEIDQMLQLGANTGNNSLEMIQSLLSDIRSKSMVINNLFSSLFDDASRMESGKDALTNLLNRRFMSTVLKHEVNLALDGDKHLAVTMLDVDHFKKVNDTWGHSTGDDVLRHISALLTENTRASDYVFRYGGEEFLIVYLETDRAQTRKYVENLRKAIHETPFVTQDGNTLTLSASFGVSHYRGHPDYQKMVDEADKALYDAKNSGRNRVVEFVD